MLTMALSLIVFMICRAVIGRPFITTEPGNYSSKATSQEYGSVVGDRSTAVGTFREFAFFGEEAIYPEHMVLYKRVYHESTTDAGDDRVESMAASEAFCQTAEAVSGLGDKLPKRTAGDGLRKPMTAGMGTIAGDGLRRPMAARTRSTSPTWMVDPVRASWRAPGGRCSSRVRFE